MATSSVRGLWRSSLILTIIGAWLDRSSEAFVNAVGSVCRAVVAGFAPGR